MPCSRVCLILMLLTVGLARGAAPEVPPWASNAFTVETGLLWQAGENTPLSYRLIPTQLSWRSPRVFGLTRADGSQWVVRHRLTLLATAVAQGPESHYLAFNASPSIERWNRAGTWCFFGGAGGGFGWLDSQAVRGAQGQDFTFNWFARAGIERATSGRGSWNAGVMFQHMSNGGQTEPNPGIDAVGFTVGYAWSF
jgi:lipid A 3-O-deacylase